MLALKFYLTRFNRWYTLIQLARIRITAVFLDFAMLALNSFLQHENKNMNLVIMGVCGCGKSTIGKLLADELGARFIEGDSFHPAENVQRMSAGIPLTDADRQPWLERLRDELSTTHSNGSQAVLSCSALKKSYRQTLASSGPLTFVYLQAERAEIERRMSLRQDHFMVATLVTSQFETLQEPGVDEACIRVSVLQSVPHIVQEILKKLPR